MNNLNKSNFNFLKKNYLYNNIYSSDNLDKYSLLNGIRKIKILNRKIRCFSYIKKKVIKFKFNKIIIIFIINIIK